MIRLNPIKSG